MSFQIKDMSFQDSSSFPNLVNSQLQCVEKCSSNTLPFPYFDIRNVITDEDYIYKTLFEFDDVVDAQVDFGPHFLESHPLDILKRSDCAPNLLCDNDNHQVPGAIEDVKFTDLSYPGVRQDVKEADNDFHFAFFDVQDIQRSCPPPPPTALHNTQSETSLSIDYSKTPSPFSFSSSRRNSNASSFSPITSNPSSPKRNKKILNGHGYTDDLVAIKNEAVTNLILSSILDSSEDDNSVKVGKPYIPKLRKSHKVARGICKAHATHTKVVGKVTEKECYDYSAAVERGYKYYIESSCLVNHAKLEDANELKSKVFPILIELKEDEEETVTRISRTRYVREDLSCLDGLHEGVKYERNPLFGLERPYEPEFFRFKYDPVSNFPFNTSRAGLCPYCPDLEFRNMKTSTYAQHLVLWHGIQTDNYLTPNPYMYGVYKLSKNKNLDKRKTIAHVSNRNGVVCPVCHNVIETECSKKTEGKPLSGYLRHFREEHRRSTSKGGIHLFFNLQQD